MHVQKFNISKPKKYINREGVEKTQWNNIGTLTEFHKDDGSISRILEIPALSLEASVFPFQEQGSNKQRSTAHNQPDEDINPEDIPF